MSATVLREMSKYQKEEEIIETDPPPLFFKVLFLFKEHFGLKIEHRSKKVDCDNQARWLSASYISHWFSRPPSRFPHHELYL